MIQNKIIQTPEFIPSLTTIKNFSNYPLALNFLKNQNFSHFMISAYDLHYLNYKEEIQTKSDFLFFLDSGAFEIYNQNNSLNWKNEQLLNCIGKFRPDVVVSLDDINFNVGNRYEDYENYNLLRKRYENTGIFYEFVLQGRNFEEIRLQLDKFELDKKIFAFCYPERYLGNNFKTRKENLTKILKIIKEEYGFSEILFHLMGCSYPKFLKQYSQMGVDLFDGVHWNDSIYDKSKNMLLDFSELLSINCNCSYCTQYKVLMKNNLIKAEIQYELFAFGHNLLMYKELMEEVRIDDG
ncbi:hypothetical protein WKT22_04085 [Candidatus Lokiarchaeum ossiferum]